jgi:hypothetical protein
MLLPSWLAVATFACVDARCLSGGHGSRPIIRLPGAKKKPQ